VAGREISTADNARSERPAINGRKNLKMPPKDSPDQHPRIYLFHSHIPSRNKEKPINHHYSLMEQDEVSKTYSFPKSYVSYRKPRAVSAEQRERARQMMIERNRTKED